jgi:hypothetical protein
MKPDPHAQLEALKAALSMMGFEPEQLLATLGSHEDPWQWRLALASVHVRFDDWSARRLAPGATLLDLERARAWFDAVHPASGPLPARAAVPNERRREAVGRGRCEVLPVLPNGAIAPP